MFYIYVKKEPCPYCFDALDKLKKNKLPYKKIVAKNNKEKELFKKQHKMCTFPQIFFLNKKNKMIKIGGLDELSDLLRILRILTKAKFSNELIETFDDIMLLLIDDNSNKYYINGGAKLSDISKIVNAKYSPELIESFGDIAKLLSKNYDFSII